MIDALVLAGGGVAGIAWELGVLQGIEVDLDLDEYIARMTEATRGAADDGEPPDPVELRRRMGAMALATATVREDVRLASIAARLPRPEWPRRTLLIPAVDANTGEFEVFTRDSGVALVDAVAASCAVPGVWPPVTIGQRRFVDGGVRSGTNTDLARGADRIVLIAPAPPGAPAQLGDLNAEIAALAPGTTHIVWADEASVAAFGTNPLSPATRGPAARAGRAVGRARAQALGAFLRPA
ncbi:patatin-like phospholipase family protein [Actinoplanes sp. N902-109]|uniref:patatin-like phospholipase family protein n=1 Tax=Actinoplanes sp. (strain N902-109) TaxID=649831 RepID=UPI0005A14B86|nr:patatin-like phospholipase family protein [Actinoplanes sp. N902-109]